MIIIIIIITIKNPARRGGAGARPLPRAGAVRRQLLLHPDIQYYDDCVYMCIYIYIYMYIYIYIHLIVIVIVIVKVIVKVTVRVAVTIVTLATWATSAVAGGAPHQLFVSCICIYVFCFK